MLDGDEILNNKVRRLIYNYIVSYPGVSYNSLKTIFELTDSSLGYHLHYLEKHNKINFDLKSGIRYYYPFSTLTSIPIKSQGLLKSYRLTSNQQYILDVILQYPGINQKEVVNKTGINRFKVRRNLDTLKKLNLIRNSNYQNTVCYEYALDEEMRYRILKELIIEFLREEFDEQTFLKLKVRLDRL